jgi:hypothetical protein
MLRGLILAPVLLAGCVSSGLRPTPIALTSENYSALLNRVDHEFADKFDFSTRWPGAPKNIVITQAQIARNGFLRTGPSSPNLALFCVHFQAEDGDNNGPFKARRSFANVISVESDPKGPGGIAVHSHQSGSGEQHVCSMGDPPTNMAAFMQKWSAGRMSPVGASAALTPLQSTR